MLLSAGDRLGPYEIIVPIGVGGMGQVWKARDTRLDRTVAIKVSAAEFSARFEREARAVAALNHPHICQLYDVGPNYLVMELIEGKQLAGPLPLDQALEYAIQIAEALDAAHRKGVVHRDLKPANIMATKAGVKLLDFGLAKRMGVAKPDTLSHAAATEETKTIALTKEHTILGTLQYMSPEQLEAKEADARSDIFAFGAVLYEMLTGRRAFEGPSQASLISQIMSREPPSVSDVAPAVVDHIVRRCLAKDPDDRWQTARDLALELRWIRESGAPTPTTAPPPRSKLLERLTWAGIAISTAAALAFGFLLMRQSKPVPAPVRFTVNTPENGSLPLLGRPSVSPDGKSIAFGVADPASRKPVWYLHSLSSGTSRALPGTEDATSVYWSFDSRSLLLLRSGALWKMDLAGGDPQRLPMQNVAYSSWQPEGIVSGGTATGLQWFRPDGSDLRLLKKAGGKDGGYRYPTLLPGGRWFLYNEGAGGPSGLSLHIASLDGKMDRPILTLERAAIYVEPGYVLSLRGDQLTAQAMDAGSGKLRGEPAPIAGPVTVGALGANTNDTLGAFSASANGVLAFRRGSAIQENRLMWFDRSGKTLGTAGGIADYSNPALSPDGNRLAVGIRDPATAKRDIWIFDLQRDISSRFTFDPADDFNPAWSPDGTSIAFVSDRLGVRDLYVKNASGSGEDELLLSSKVPKSVESWSQNGRWLVFTETNGGNGNDLAVLSTENRRAQDFLRTPYGEDHGRLSPDGEWMAYRSNESGRSEVYIRPFPPSGGKWQISNSGGGEPQWSGDGKELFYTTLQDPARIMAVDIAVRNGGIDAGIPHELFDVRLPGGNPRNRYVATRDGKKFLAIVQPEQKAANSFTVIVNWPSLMKK